MVGFPLAPILASIPFLASMGFTPGPNNILVASSGVNFGFRATIPHMLGITLGFPLMQLMVGLGLARVFLAIPWIHAAFKYMSVAYLVYLSWRVATATSIQPTGRTARPLTFWQAAAFQWINAKAWIIAVSAVTTYTVVNATLPWQIGAIALIDLVITMLCVSCWTWFGHLLRDYLRTPTHRRAFNLSMALLLLLSILPVFWE